MPIYKIVGNVSFSYSYACLIMFEEQATSAAFWIPAQLA
ncbi:Uncharacterised protein [Slackia heliotrinireducens]|nr:Uncharacterised protein [Slackia heliotrinireducens]